MMDASTATIPITTAEQPIPPQPVSVTHEQPLLQSMMVMKDDNHPEMESRIQTQQTNQEQTVTNETQPPPPNSTTNATTTSTNTLTLIPPPPSPHSTQTQSDTQTSVNESLHPSIFIPANSSATFTSALTSLSRALHAKDRYQSSLAQYQQFIREKNELVMAHGATTQIKQLIIEKQRPLKRSLPYETVYRYSEREGEIKQAEEAYRSRGESPPKGIIRRRIILEPIRPQPRVIQPKRERAEKSEKPPRLSHAHYTLGAANSSGPLAPGSGVRTIFGQTDMRAKIKAQTPYQQAAAGNPLLTNTDRASAHADANSLGSWSGLAVARSVARRNGTLLPSFPLVYSSFVSSLGTWFNAHDLAARVRIKENSNFITWVECFGYDLPDGDATYESFGPEVKADLDAQWRDFVWRGLFPPARCDVWNRHLKKEKLKVERNVEQRTIRMLPLPGWQRLDTDPPEDPAPDSVPPQPTPRQPRAAIEPSPHIPTNAANHQPPRMPLMPFTGPPNELAPPNPQMLMFMQQVMMMQMQQQMLAANNRQQVVAAAAMQQKPFIQPPLPSPIISEPPNAGQQTELVIDSEDTIDGDLVITNNNKLEAQVDRLIDTSNIPPVTIPCPFLPITISKIGCKSIFYLILYAHLDRYVSTSEIRQLAQHHFPASWRHFHTLITTRFPHLAGNANGLAYLFERHLVRFVLEISQRQQWNSRLGMSEGVRIEAITGVSGSLFRLQRLANFQRPPGEMALGDRLMATLRVPAASTVQAPTSNPAMASSNQSTQPHTMAQTQPQTQTQFQSHASTSSNIPMLPPMSNDSFQSPSHHQPYQPPQLDQSVSSHQAHHHPQPQAQSAHHFSDSASMGQQIQQHVTGRGDEFHSDNELHQESHLNHATANNSYFHEPNLMQPSTPDFQPNEIMFDPHPSSFMEQ